MGPGDSSGLDGISCDSLYRKLISQMTVSERAPEPVALISSSKAANIGMIFEV